MQARIRVEVVRAEPRAATLKTYLVPATATVAEVLRLAAADPDFTGVDFTAAAVGVFGSLVRHDQVLKDGDRVEIYRGPAVDPKSARRARVKLGRAGRA